MSTPNFRYEKLAWNRGFNLVAGLDEVGRGAIAGPVVTGCVVWSKSSVAKIQQQLADNGVQINDSKKLTSKQRENAELWIKKHCLSCSFGRSTPKEIDKIGIVKATEKAFRRSIYQANKKINKNIQYLLVDAFYIPYVKGIPMARKNYRRGKMSNNKPDNKSKQTAIVKGDEKSFSIACASIIAKVYRDKIMANLSTRPEYKKFSWEKNKGYGTKEHRLSIKNYNLTKYHRKSFCKM